MKNKFFKIIGSIALSFTLTSVSWANYTDISGNFAESSIEKWSNYGIITGYDNKFRPDDYITRGEIAVILNKILQLEKNNSSNKYTDIQDKYYKDDILSLAQNGIITGYNSNLRPDDNITRQEVAVILAKAFNIKSSKGDIDFKDKDNIAPWAKDILKSMIDNGYLNGYNGYIRPQNAIKRSEFIKIIDNMIVNYIDKEGEYDGKNLKNGITVIASDNVSIKNYSSDKSIVISTKKEIKNLRFINVNLKNDLILPQKSKNINLYLENSVLYAIKNSSSNLKTYKDKDSQLLNTDIKTNILSEQDKLENIKLEKKKSENSKNQSSASSSNNYEDEYSPIEPDTSIKKEEQNKDNTGKENEIVYEKELSILMDGLSSDGKIHIKYTGNEINLEDKYIIINKQNGENTGEKLQILFDKNDMEKLKKGEKGNYKVSTSLTQELVINEKNYKTPNFIVEFVIY